MKCPLCNNSNTNQNPLTGNWTCSNCSASWGKLKGYGITVYHIDTEQIYHVCLYPSPATMNDVKALTLELATDPTFGLVGKMDKIGFRPTTKEELSEIPHLPIKHISEIEKETYFRSPFGKN